MFRLVCEDPVTADTNHSNRSEYNLRQSQSQLARPNVAKAGRCYLLLFVPTLPKDHIDAGQVVFWLAAQGLQMAKPGAAI